MTADPFDHRCARCHTALLEDAASGWCTACENAPRPLPRAGRLAAWWRRLRTPAARVSPDPDRLIWALDPRDARPADVPVIRDWLLLHRVTLATTDDLPGPLEIRTTPAGAVLLVPVTDQPDAVRIPLILEPPVFQAAACYAPLHPTDLATHHRDHA
ncbi:hypothetical protein [Actinoplanes sp. NBRC 101535]|uniref:hypothetical protein n=1 Tax=Actinoplanes sp. NBRC 101535 TaxID=3032196 RepID=UPI0024A57212|nr:hypothetical protein [Actinoplanes sp. NBRC 101535]GLY08222.1 hypothetical protein Acsp01_86010 [Actinoplanes sp. NBRC 101535]